MCMVRSTPNEAVRHKQESHQYASFLGRFRSAVSIINIRRDPNPLKAIA
jgi:hypothetical protein